jgi:hypothetical protein
MKHLLMKSHGITLTGQGVTSHGLDAPPMQVCTPQPTAHPLSLLHKLSQVLWP